jgi:hypothetical protein
MFRLINDFNIIEGWNTRHGCYLPLITSGKIKRSPASKHAEWVSAGRKKIA